MDSEEECPICFEKMFQPKKLPCMHKFCWDCYTKIADPDQKNVKCSLCRQEHKFGFGYDTVGQKI